MSKWSAITRLVAAGDEDQVLYPCLARLIHDVLERGPVDDGQHLLRHCLGGGQESRAETGDREDGLSKFSSNQVSTFQFPQPWRSLTFSIKGPIETVMRG